MKNDLKKLANDEIQEVLVWLCEEKERIGRQLDDANPKRGLDNNRAAYAGLHAEFARRMEIIGRKYGLLPKETP